MSAPTIAEAPPNVPPQQEVEQLTNLLIAGASVTAIVGFLGGLAGVGPAAANRLVSISEVDGLLQLKGPVGVATKGNPILAQHLSNLRRRASYFINAGRRLGTGVVREHSQPGALQAAVEAERGYLRQHLLATAKRNDAAAAVAAQTNRTGAEVGWYAIRDERTSPECRAAHGHNFEAGKPPKIGYPGTVHLNCRCKPVAPWPGAGSVDEVTRNTDRRIAQRRRTVKLARAEVDSRTLPDIPNKPGKTNWVEKSGGLPSYIKRIAKHLQAQGHSPGSAIATAVNTVRRWAAGGTVTAHGGPNVSPVTQAQAAAAYAEWKAKAAASHGSGKKD